IRTLAPFPGTEAAAFDNHTDKGIENRYEFYRDKIREEIDRVMLEKIYPTGTMLRELRVADTRFEFSLARPIQSYAITVKIPTKLPIGSFVDCIVASHRERSIIALPVPIAINHINAKALEYIPGIGKRTASDIILKRPFTEIESVLKITPSINRAVADQIIFD
ncbi:MAG TPA: hypothetical protein VF857_10795, partial [Spirochaetota bacterium]